MGKDRYYGMEVFKAAKSSVALRVGEFFMEDGKK